MLPKGPALTTAKAIGTGKDSFVINAYKNTDKKTIRVWTYKPRQWQQGDKVLFVMHGMGRNGEDYLNTWVSIAQQHSVLLIAPEFHNKYFRYTTNDYQDGNLYDFFGRQNPKSEWAFQVIENIIEHINQNNPFDIDQYDMFGH